MPKQAGQAGRGMRALKAPSRSRTQGGTQKRAVRGVSGEKTTFQDVLLAAMSEKAFQSHVVKALKARGYLVWTIPNMMLTARGLPDVIAVHPDRVPRRVIFWELKTQAGRVRPEQKVALAALDSVFGVDARVIRPSDWLETLEDL